MKVILVGAQHEKGVNDFKGANAEEYDNLVLDIVFPFKEVNSSNRKVTGIGREVKKAKCNWENFKEVFQGKIEKIEDLEKYFDTEIDVFFYKNRRIELVLLDK